MFTQGMVVHETYRDADGGWVQPADVRIEGSGDARHAVHAETGVPIEIGSIEKMSKSKRNTVDPDDIIAAYGADTARWFMLSDSPPERDVIWSEEGVQGAYRFVQRLWRLVNEVVEVVAAPQADAESTLGPESLLLRKATHRALAGVEDDIERLRFNRCVAQIYELANALQAALAGAHEADSVPADMGFALREAADVLVQLVAPMMPHLAETCWEQLGHGDLVAETPWPEADRSLLVEDEITLPVQVNGKRRADITIARDADRAAIEAAVLSLDAVRRAVGDAPVKKIIVVPQRIVNVVA
jgi:leucyl-tRNA synthetase